MAAARSSTPSSVGIPHDTGGVGAARHAVAAGFAGSGVASDAVDDAVLVVSELVSNAVRHAAALPSGGIRVRWSLEPDHLHLEIVDGGAPTRPTPGVAGLSAMGGRGLDIVQAVTDRWGVDDHDDGVTVWADVPRTRNTEGPTLG